MILGNDSDASEGILERKRGYLAKGLNPRFDRNKLNSNNLPPFCMTKLSSRNGFGLGKLTARNSKAIHKGEALAIKAAGFLHSGDCCRMQVWNRYDKIAGQVLSSFPLFSLGQRLILSYKIPAPVENGRGKTHRTTTKKELWPFKVCGGLVV